jgi:class 3 adenylate cyclase/tetratricopeptide (TPR) repeat protein
MSAPDIAPWLHALGLGRYEQAFRDNDIDGEVLTDLDDADLEKLGVSLGHRKKLLKAIAALRAPGRSAPAEGDAAAGIEGERRQVTVLFADLVGYTRLTHELGAEAMHAITDRFFGLADGVIERFGGSIDKHIGDCVMAVFGAPVAHGNDPERAVRAALAIRDAMPELSRELGCTLSAHIGIASGQVVASRGVGHKTYSITGDSVNLASRLTDQAAAGTILVSEPVRRLLADRLEHAEVDAFDLKGLAAPVRAFQILALREAGVAERPFVGRRVELQQLESVLAACLAHGRGQAVHIRGEAGIGKTRLVDQVQRHAMSTGFACHKGLVLDFGAGAGQDAIGSLVRSLLGLSAASDEAAVSAALEAAMHDGLAAADRTVFLTDLLDLPQPTALRALYDAMDHDARSRGRQDALAELVERAGRQIPRLIVVEDVHWADGPTLGHLARLAQTAGAARAVLVMTSRLEGDPLDHVWRSSAGGSPLLTLDLGPLRDDEAGMLAHAYVDASADLARRCVARAAGNPLFLDQLLRHAEESAEEGVPGSVQSLVQARLDHLSPGDRQALQAASVLGQRFTADALGHLVGLPTHDCTNLVRHLLVRSIGDEFLFAHALIRDGVYDSLLRSRRAALHLRAAEWFATRDAGLHAEHLDRAQDPGAPDAYLEAARSQLATYRYDAALDLAERGLAIARTGQQTFALTCLRGDILHDLGAMAEAGAAYAAALAAASDDAQRCRAWLGLAAVKRVTDDLDGAFADLERAQTAAQVLGLEEQLARIHFLRGNLHFPRSNLEACLQEHSKSLACAQEVGAPDLEAAALGGLGDAEYARGRMLTARGYFERCIAICRQHGFGRIEVTSLPMAAITRFYAGEIGEAYADALAAVRAAEQVGHYRAAIIGCHIVYFTAMARGEVAIAGQHVDRALDLSRQLGALRFEAEALWFRGELLQGEGRPAEALVAIRQALEICRTTGMSYIGPALLGALARATDEAAERRAALAEAEQLLAQGSISHNYLWFYQAAIETSLEQADWDGVERYAQALAGYTSAEPLPFLETFIARGRALAAFGRDPHHPDVARDLEHPRRRASEIGWLAALPALDAALDSYSGRQAS